MEDKDTLILKDNSLITQPNQNNQQVEQLNSPLICPSISPFTNQQFVQEEQSTSSFDPFFLLLLLYFLFLLLLHQINIFNK
jgi:hypothetical protein